ncbi:MAG: NAD(P)H-dependent oxidoreductase subunit E [Caldilineaceae bacterium]
MINEFGYCRVDAQNELAEMLNLEPAEVEAVVDFYHMLHRRQGQVPRGGLHQCAVHVAQGQQVHAPLRGATGHSSRRDRRTISSRWTTWNASARAAPRPWSP